MINKRHISILSGGSPDVASSVVKLPAAIMQRLAIDLQRVSAVASNLKTGGEA